MSGTNDYNIGGGGRNHTDYVISGHILFHLVRPGGTYAIEDIGSSWNRAYGHLRPREPDGTRLERTALGLVTRWLERGELPEVLP